MKKTLIALAALAAVGSSFAQSSVTLYGRMDLGMATNKVTTIEDDGTPSDVKTTNFAGKEGSATTNRFGVKGTEDLGGGLKLNFGVETKMVGGAGDTTFGKTRTYILQLAGSFGAVTMGTYSGNSIDNLRSYSVSKSGVAGGDTTNVVMGDGFAGFKLGAPTRSEKSIGYRSPNFNGMTVGFGTTNEKLDEDGHVTKTSGYMGDVTYSAGPLSMMLALASGKSRDDGEDVDAKQNDVGFAVSYNFGMAVPYFLVENAKVTDNMPGGGSIKASATEIGSKFPMGALTPYITLSRGKVTEDGVAGEYKISAYQIGTNYDLSKTTYIYAAVGSQKIKNDLRGDSVKTTGAALGLVKNF